MRCAAREDIVLSVGFDVDECLVCFLSCAVIMDRKRSKLGVFCPMYKLMDMYKQRYFVKSQASIGELIK